jgi:AGCS family alanine or glycine:cation symporter
MFQAWNVGEVTQVYFNVPSWISGIILAAVVGSVIIGGIKRIGMVAGTLVPFMVILYLGAGLYVLAINFSEIPEIFALIFKSAFAPTEASGAFIGGTAASALLFGLKRAVFSTEAGQGSSPIAHAAAKTDEPAREGIVAGLEPFIDTIVVCTFTALIILSTGIWNRAPDVPLDTLPTAVDTAAGWQFSQTAAPGDDWVDDDRVMLIVKGNANDTTGNALHRVEGIIATAAGGFVVNWVPIASTQRPVAVDDGMYRTYVGATLTAKAFDSVTPGLGKWLVTIAAWLFAISTMISWGYYGEQGIVYLAGDKLVLPYKIVYCLLIIIATLGIIKTDADLDNITGVGTAVMVFGNLPICWLFGYQAMKAYKDYIARLKSGRMGPDHPPPHLDDLLSGRDVQK